MKFDVNILRYIEKDAWRVLVSVEMGMKNHELVPVELVNAISGLKHGGAYKYIRELLKHKLVHHENQKYDGYRLTPLGYDFLAIKAFVNRGAIVGVGRRIGVGKESDVFEVVTEEGETLALKLHRLGRTSFRAVKSKRDYIKSTTTHTNWLYLSRLAALKEHAFMKALGDNGFPVPKAVDVNRHAVLMSLIDGTPLTQRYKCADPGKVYAQCVEQLANLARCGLVHCDFNEFNIMCNDDLDITVIDFPQMVSSNHPNAEEFFVRDLKCLHKFFLRRFNYRADEDPNGVPDPKFFDVAAGGVGHGAGEGVEKSLDVSLRASGFTAAAGRDLDEYNAAREAQRDAEEGVDEDERGDKNDDDDDDEDEDHRHASASDSSDDDFEGQRGGDERSRFGYVERGEEEVEEAREGSSSDGGSSNEEEEEDPEADAAAAAAVARLYGAGGSIPTIDEESAAEHAGVERDASSGSGDDSSEYDEGEGRRSKKWTRGAAAPSTTSTRRRRPDGDAVSVGRSSMFSTRSRADAGNDPELVRARLKQQKARGKAKASASRAPGTRNHTKDRGGKRGAKGHQFKYDGYGGQVTL